MATESRPMPAGRPDWAVIGQTPATRPGVSGAFVDGMLVHFRLGTGTVSTVFVPDNALTPQVVADAISAKAQRLAAIAALSSQR